MKKILKWVEGNPFALAIPLEKEVYDGEGTRKVYYVPTAGTTVTVTLVGGAGSGNKSYEARIQDGYIARIQDDGTLARGIYDVEVKALEPDGTRRRSMWTKQVQIVRNNGEVLQQWDEFAEMSGEVLDAAVFFAGERGEKGEKGDKGDKGEKGDRGEPGQDGRDGVDGTPGRDGVDGAPGAPGRDGVDGQDGRDGVDGAPGQDGQTPYIDPTTKHWMIGSTDTGILAEGAPGRDGRDGQDGLPGRDGVDGQDGRDGVDGQDGRDGVDGAPGQDGQTPYIDPTTKHWMIGQTDTGIVAEGQTPDMSNYVQKSQTAGLLKNDGSVDTNTYLIQHQDISGKEDVTTIEERTTAVTSLITEVGKYYRLDVAVGTLVITLPAVTDVTKVRTVIIFLTAGNTPAVTITAAGGASVYRQAGYGIEAGKTYEVNALWNGAAWVVATVEIDTN